MACGHTWEMFQSMNDNPVKSCPKCKKRKAKRLLGLGAGIIFKGTGFYETDYKNKRGGEKKEGSSEGNPSSSDSSKSSDSTKSSGSKSSSTKKETKKSANTKKPKK
jgi:putative FmdB family regulatory protein